MITQQGERLTSNSYAQAFSDEFETLVIHQLDLKQPQDNISFAHKCDKEGLKLRTASSTDLSLPPLKTQSGISEDTTRR